MVVVTAWSWRTGLTRAHITRDLTTEIVWGWFVLADFDRVKEVTALTRTGLKR